jgi:hypothetical protein
MFSTTTNILMNKVISHIIEHEIKDNRDTDKSASYLDIQLQIDSSEGRLRTERYDKEMISIFPL